MVGVYSVAEDEVAGLGADLIALDVIPTVTAFYGVGVVHDLKLPAIATTTTFPAAQINLQIVLPTIETVTAFGSDQALIMPVLQTSTTFHIATLSSSIHLPAFETGTIFWGFEVRAARRGGTSNKLRGKKAKQWSDEYRARLRRLERGEELKYHRNKEVEELLAQAIRLAKDGVDVERLGFETLPMRQESQNNALALLLL